MSKKLGLFFLITIIFHTGNLWANEGEGNIRIISKGVGNKEYILSMTKRKYRWRVRKLMTLFEDASIPVIEEKEREENNKWRLMSIEVGPGLAASVGIGHWHIGGVIGFRLLFERNEGV